MNKTSNVPKSLYDKLRGASNKIIIKNQSQSHQNKSNMRSNYYDGKQNAKKCGFKFLRKMEYVSAVRTFTGRELQRYGSSNNIERKGTSLGFWFLKSILYLNFSRCNEWRTGVICLIRLKCLTNDSS